MHLTKYRRGYDDSQVTSRRLGGSFTIPEWCAPALDLDVCGHKGRLLRRYQSVVTRP